MQPLADAGYRVIAPDLRGFGGTQAPEEVRYGSMELIGDMVGLLDALNAPDAVIVGNDWGATLAWQAAQVRPDRFRAVAAVGVPKMGRSPAPPTTLFPATADEEFYVTYFQHEGEAEAELDADVETSLRKILYAPREKPDHVNRRRHAQSVGHGPTSRRAAQHSAPSRDIFLCDDWRLWLLQITGSLLTGPPYCFSRNSR